MRQSKGVDYIRKARAGMTQEEIETASTLTYNHGDLTFLGVCRRLSMIQMISMRHGSVRLTQPSAVQSDSRQP